MVPRIKDAKWDVTTLMKPDTDAVTAARVEANAEAKQREQAAEITANDKVADVETHTKMKPIGAVLLAENHLNSKEKSPISTKKAGQEDARRRNKNT